MLLTLKSGDHVLVGDDVYGGTFRIFDKVLKQFGIDGDVPRHERPARASRAAMRPSTRLVWMETPSNPMLKVFDIAAIADVARGARRARSPSTTRSRRPMLQRPLALGATLVVHSTTKYLNGHSDVVGGAVMTSDDALAERLHFLQKSVGGVPSPFDCYLVLRGLKTLGVRMKRHVESARARRRVARAATRRSRGCATRGSPSHEGTRSRSGR